MTIDATNIHPESKPSVPKGRREWVSVQLKVEIYDSSRERLSMRIEVLWGCDAGCLLMLPGGSPLTRSMGFGNLRAGSGDTDSSFTRAEK